MQESRKRGSTVPMGVFGSAIDSSVDQPTEREQAVDEDDTGRAAREATRRAVLDVSLDHSESEREIADLLVVARSNPAFLQQDDSVSVAESNSGQRVEQLMSNEARDRAKGLGSASGSLDGRTGVEDGDPLEVVAERINRFSVRVLELSSEDEEPSSELDNGEDGGDEQRLSDATADLGNAMKALFDNRKATEWEDFIRAEEEADTDDQRDASESSSGDEAAEFDDAESPLVPVPIQMPIDKSVVGEPLVVVEPADIESMSSLVPLEANNAPPPGLPLIRGGVAGAATAIVLLAATTWAVIEARGNQPVIEPSEGPASTTKSLVQAEVLPGIASRIARSATHIDRQSMQRLDENNLEQQSDQPKKPEAGRLSRRSMRAVKSNRRDEPQTQTALAPTTEPASAESRPVEVAQDPISPEPLPETPSRDAIFATLASLRSQVRQCVENEVGVAELDINIKGSGRVSHVVVQGDFRGTKQGSCIARVVRKARFEPFKQPDFRVLFPYAF